MNREAIAIIGIGCRFPGAKDKEAFWQLLRDGVDAITEVPSDRWDADSFYDPDPTAPNKMNTRWGGFLRDIDRFDPEFFKISPREAVSLDPQQRLLLEVTWEALEDAGQMPERLAGTQTGVFMGINSFDYYALLMENPANVDAHAGTGNTNCIAANRISYLLNLTGPSFGVDTACSSSLVAVHLACQSLWSGESTMAIVGGVRVMLSPWITVSFSQAGFMAPDGRCKAFDSRANGYVRSEGAGIVILKPLSQALSDRDPIYAVIRGSAVNQDGRSNGLTAPNPHAQEAVLRLAYRQAGVSPGQVQYIEAHGTGTKLGDPIEIKALGKILAEDRPPGQYCTVGSVKTNIGHAETAAGIAGLIKVALSLQHRQIPPSLHFQEPNPYIPFDKLPLRVQQNLAPWPEGESPPLAGVSSFSFGGTNAHVVLEGTRQQDNHKKALEQGEVTRGEKTPSVHLLTLSARSEIALQDLVKSYEKYFTINPEKNIEDICFTANTGRSHFAHRLAITTPSTAQLYEQLKAFPAQQSGVLSGQIQSKKPPKIAFLFTGQGCHYPDMGRELYNTQPIFRQALEECDRLLHPHLEQSLLSILYPESDHQALLLNRPAYLQPALFALEYALAQLWQSWGIMPAVVMGHSLGEYPAACIAGAFSLEEGLELIAHRGRLMEKLSEKGQMAVVFATYERVAEVVAPYQSQVTIAAINGSENTVISGEEQAISNVLHQLESDKLTAQLLKVSQPFHSHLIEPILDEFTEIAQRIQYRPPRIPFISTLTGKKLQPQQCLDAQYWRRQTREPVQFGAGIQTLVQEGYDCFLEIGPHPILIGMGKRCFSENTSTWLFSLKKGHNDSQAILSSLSHLYLKGLEIDWTEFYRNYQGQKLHLPTYPFQRQRYWINLPKPMNIKESNTQLCTIDSKTAITSTLQAIMASAMQTEPERVSVHSTFLEFGADSIVLIDAVRRIQDTFAIQVSIAQLFEELPTIDSLATYINQNLSADFSLSFATDTKLQAPSTDSIASSKPQESDRALLLDRIQSQQEGGIYLEKIIAQQLDLISQQLELLRNNMVPERSVSRLSIGETKPESRENLNLLHNLPLIQSNGSTTAASVATQSNRNGSTKEFKSNRALRKDSGDSLNPSQQKYLQMFITRYIQRTQKSKQRAQVYRPVLADRRSAIGFWHLIKEMIYPIVGEKSQGAKLWDVDGNEYVDLTMGFGVHLFGHKAPFITTALEEQIQQGMQIGPQSQLAGEVAELIAEMTNMERVVFCNSGTEAVMTAVRLARAATGRDKIAIFAGSYHGHFDGTLVMPQGVNGKPYAVPLVPGVPQKIADDILVLTYDDPKSLEIIKAHADELAAVLVEPVQSRRPDLQPKQFLQQLRQLTKETQVTLIFDEVLTGFRVHPGGCQALFDVKADLAVYGKVVGGGLPIGVVAGSAYYMDRIDGGMWMYGDDSYPEVPMTFFAGTFSKNPLTMAAARAVLKHMKMQGGKLQQQLNQQTEKLAATLNAYFQQEGVPIKVLHFASFFRFTYAGNVNEFYLPIEFELLFYHLIEKGVYIWEGRTCFLSVAHTEEDIERVISAVKDSVLSLSGVFV
ncbi:aminotransferase class III-fold pyridoxal phosphate-dependent enzyme [Aetokthonos hydrillicola Thurmond2011]|jgi:glutamate-1-semialdehyde-2,1-aminomutase|uniref:Aminotransferase class III-fold pyridoxal phosphate-dependent enzyme n=1 Tax=Aetokthonos hydrillicola Thurmond2011 TaxID=2712845 RepID=A0AAP5M8S2_9CYAN|nr:type I polyketide synthase [Aetokthonos hydrillicola]MBO3462772.1 aminotransferase class III-fold pyridoxal phosphate-dependent enzyme [Aetokthonos hydrillicola CCALA 1050]MBW4590653.1 aminotransferase class III-fold pyridoxal phosphate-dependent enzyme [Aetokthonos hydrillicola CCALA 1050]MDR9895007.1 aminotransferase class III-fold pyridoxal phosphate-dependent enzyme [Aetokthonos hydrillicola Thurmond2011]